MRNLFILLTPFLLSGCAVWEQLKSSVGLIPETSSIEVVIEASSDLNKRENESPSPVLLRIYELSSPVLFRSLDFFSIFENDKAALGDEYIKRYEYQIQPDGKEHFVLELDPNTRAIGFAAGFRDIDGSSWRKVEVLEERSEYFLRLTLSEKEITSDNTKGIEQTYF